MIRTSPGLGTRIDGEVLLPVVVDVEVHADGGLPPDAIESGTASLWAAPGLIHAGTDESAGLPWYDRQRAGGYRVMSDVDTGRVPGSWSAVQAARLTGSTFRALLLPLREGAIEMTAKFTRADGSEVWAGGFGQNLKLEAAPLRAPGISLYRRRRRRHQGQDERGSPGMRHVSSDGGSSGWFRADASSGIESDTTCWTPTGSDAGSDAPNRRPARARPLSRLGSRFLARFRYLFESVSRSLAMRSLAAANRASSDSRHSRHGAAAAAPSTPATRVGRHARAPTIDFSPRAAMAKAGPVTDSALAYALALLGAELEMNQTPAAVTRAVLSACVGFPLFAEDLHCEGKHGAHSPGASAAFATTSGGTVPFLASRSNVARILRVWLTPAQEARAMQALLAAPVPLPPGARALADSSSSTSSSSSSHALSGASRTPCPSSHDGRAASASSATGQRQSLPWTPTNANEAAGSGRRQLSLAAAADYALLALLALAMGQPYGAIAGDDEAGAADAGGGGDSLGRAAAARRSSAILMLRRAARRGGIPLKCEASDSDDQAQDRPGRSPAGRAGHVDPFGVPTSRGHATSASYASLASLGGAASSDPAEAHAGALLDLALSLVRHGGPALVSAPSLAGFVTAAQTCSDSAVTAHLLGLLDSIARPAPRSLAHIALWMRWREASDADSLAGLHAAALRLTRHVSAAQIHAAMSDAAAAAAGSLALGEGRSSSNHSGGGAQHDGAPPPSPSSTTSSSSGPAAQPARALDATDALVASPGARRKGVGEAVDPPAAPTGAYIHPLSRGVAYGRIGFSPSSPARLAFAALWPGITQTSRASAVPASPRLASVAGSIAPSPSAAGGVVPPSPSLRPSASAASLVALPSLRSEPSTLAKAVAARLAPNPDSAAPPSASCSSGQPPAAEAAAPTTPSPSLAAEPAPRAATPPSPTLQTASFVAAAAARRGIARSASASGLAAAATDVQLASTALGCTSYDSAQLGLDADHDAGRSHLLGGLPRSVAPASEGGPAASDSVSGLLPSFHLPPPSSEPTAGSEYAHRGLGHRPRRPSWRHASQMPGLSGEDADPPAPPSSDSSTRPPFQLSTDSRDGQAGFASSTGPHASAPRMTVSGAGSAAESSGGRSAATDDAGCHAPTPADQGCTGGGGGGGGGGGSGSVPGSVSSLSGPAAASALDGLCGTSLLARDGSLASLTAAVPASSGSQPPPPQGVAAGSTGSADTPTAHPTAAPVRQRSGASHDAPSGGHALPAAVSLAAVAKLLPRRDAVADRAATFVDDCRARMVANVANALVKRVRVTSLSVSYAISAEARIPLQLLRSEGAPSSLELEDVDAAEAEDSIDDALAVAAHANVLGSAAAQLANRAGAGRIAGGAAVDDEESVSRTPFSGAGGAAAAAPSPASPVGLPSPGADTGGARDEDEDPHGLLAMALAPPKSARAVPFSAQPARAATVTALDPAMRVRLGANSRGPNSPEGEVTLDSPKLSPPSPAARRLVRAASDVSAAGSQTRSSPPFDTVSTAHTGSFDALSSMASGGARPSRWGAAAASTGAMAAPATPGRAGPPSGLQHAHSDHHPVVSTGGSGSALAFSPSDSGDSDCDAADDDDDGGDVDGGSGGGGGSSRPDSRRRRWRHPLTANEVAAAAAAATQAARAGGWQSPYRRSRLETCALSAVGGRGGTIDEETGVMVKPFSGAASGSLKTLLDVAERAVTRFSGVSDADPAARALRSVRGARGASSRRGMPGPASSRGSEGTSATSSSASASAATGGAGASVSTSSVVSFTSPYAPSLPASAARAAELAHSVRASARVPAGRVLHMPSPMALASAPDHHAAGSPAPARGSMAAAEPARSARNLSGGMPGRAAKTDARRSVSQSRAHHHGSPDGHGYAITPARGPSASRLRDRRLRRQRLAAADGGGSSSPPQEGSEPSPDQDRAVPGSSLVEPSNPSADDGSQGGPSDADDEASPGRRNRVKRGLSAELRHGSSPLRQGATTGSDASCARYFVDLVLRRWPRMDSARAVLLLKFVVAATAAWQPHSGDEVTPASIVAAGPQPARPASAEDAAMEALLRRGHLSSHDSALARRAAAAAAAASLAARRRRPREFLAMGRQAAGMPQAGDLDSAPATPSIRVPEAALATEPSRPSDEIDEGVFSAARLALMGSRDELRAALVRRVCACLRSPHGQLSTTAAGLCHPFPAASAPPSPFVSVLITSRPCALAIIEALSSPSVAQHWNSTVTKNAKTVSRGIAALALRSGLAARHDIAAAVRRASSAPGAASLGPLQHVGSPTVVTSEPPRGVPAASTSSVTPTSSDHLTRGSTMSVHGPASSPQSRAERAAEPADA
ncbi:hypothetical protein FNF29_02569 [Cafeteria roenbergensis]|uniref:Uncharacterized protein n=2 Tax=Cafeteria roenbergensis TaxID=33653 RepID=A0A5A8CNP2_CAFRO|nr:hypothetical protein FNF29_02569 [Cafeteria roenbergensis]|eukprot:KAA0154349.1 hypothetical protein FNF29_02569 [Cafeteria roenbergensis]